MRLTRRELALKMTEHKSPITPEGVGLWVIANRIPQARLSVFTRVLNNEFHKGEGPYVGDIGAHSNGV